MMSKEDEIFDNFLRRKFESKSFASKPHYWQNAQEMIAKERKSKGVFTPVIIGSVVLISAVTLAFIFTSARFSSPAISDKISVPAVAPEMYTGNAQATSMTETQLPSGSTASFQHTSQTQNTAGQPHNNNSASAAARTYNDHNNPKRKKQLKSMDEVPVQEPVQPVKSNHPTGIIDINGKTLIAPFNTADKPAPFSKTTAYITYAAKVQKSFFALEAGMTFYNPGNDLNHSINGLAGIRYYRFLSPRIGISTGLTYARLHQNLPARSYQSTDYNFGENASTVTIKTQRLDYIELPVSLLYKLVPKHTLTAGASLGYVLQSADQITNENNQTTGNSTQNGYLKAINHWDAQFNIGYQYQLTPNMWISTSCHIGVMDISNNTFFKRSETDTNKGLRLTLGYKVY